MKNCIRSLVAAMALAVPVAAAAQAPVKIYNIVELSGGGATAGTNFDNGAQILVKDYPGVLLDVTFDANGDLDRESFLVKVVNGKQVVSETLPPAGK